jgi:hypothetical protein
MATTETQLEEAFVWAETMKVGKTTLDLKTGRSKEGWQKWKEKEKVAWEKKNASSSSSTLSSCMDIDNNNNNVPSALKRDRSARTPKTIKKKAKKSDDTQ